MNRVPAGLMRHKLMLYDVPEQTVDDFGQPSETGTLIGTFRGRIQTLRGRMLIESQVTAPTATHRVTLPWLGSAIPATTDNPSREILPRMYFILEDGSRLNVVLANNLEKNNLMWELTCEEHVVT